MRPFFEGGGVREPSGCQSCQERLSAYIDVELDIDIEAAAARFPHIKAHLDKCQPCQDSYENLKALLLMERYGALYLPPVEVHFDFSYLKDIWTVVQNTGKQVVKLFTELRILVKEGFVFFDQLPRPLVAKRQVALIASRKKYEQEGELVLSLPSPENDLLIRLFVTSTASEETAAALMVEVIKGSSEKPVARARVTRRDTKGRMLESNMTRQEGRVSFAHVQAGRYVVEVKFKKQRWQIPITVTWPE